MKQISQEKIYDWFEKKNLYCSIHQPGTDNEKEVIVTNWNEVPCAMSDYLEKFYELDWEDESDCCCECFAHIHTMPTYHGWAPDYINTENGAVCKNCILDNAEDYLEDFTFWSDSLPVYPRAIPAWLKEKLQENDFVPFHSIDSECKDMFENGLHYGQTDTPEKVAALITEELGPREILFCIDSSGQFDINFSAYIKKEDI